MPYNTDRVAAFWLWIAPNALPRIVMSSCSSLYSLHYWVSRSLAGSYFKTSVALRLASLFSYKTWHGAPHGTSLLHAGPHPREAPLFHRICLIQFWLWENLDDIKQLCFKYWANLPGRQLIQFFWSAINYTARMVDQYDWYPYKVSGIRSAKAVKSFIVKSCGPSKAMVNVIKLINLSHLWINKDTH